MFTKVKKNTRGERFKFNIAHEFRIYKYLNEVLGKREEKHLCQDEKFDSYIEWEQYVYAKYKEENREYLYEFVKFLEH